MCRARVRQTFDVGQSATCQRGSRDPVADRQCRSFDAGWLTRSVSDEAEWDSWAVGYTMAFRSEVRAARRRLAQILRVSTRLATPITMSTMPMAVRLIPSVRTLNPQTKMAPIVIMKILAPMGMT